MFLILLGVFGLKPKWENGGVIRNFIVIASFLFIIYIFGISMGWWIDFTYLYSWVGEETIALVITLLVIGLVISYIMDDGKKDPNKQSSISKAFDGLFSGGSK